MVVFPRTEERQRFGWNPLDFLRKVKDSPRCHSQNDHNKNNHCDDDDDNDDNTIEYMELLHGD